LSKVVFIILKEQLLNPRQSDDRWYFFVLPLLQM